MFYYKLVIQMKELYKKIDLFGEVLDKIKKEYVDEVDQSEMIDSAINGVLQYLILILPTWIQNFKKHWDDTKGRIWRSRY